MSSPMPPREPTRAADALFGAFVLLAWAPSGVPDFLSVGLAAVLALVALGVNRRPGIRLSDPTLRLGWLLPAVVAVLGYVVVVSVATPAAAADGWQRRAARLALVVVLLLMLVGGRIHYASVVRGAAVGLVANAALFAAGAAPARYGEHLSGFLLDKNVAGLAYGVVGVLLAGLQRDTRRQVLVLVATSGFVWLTGSRTSLAALACAVVWFALRPRLGVIQRLGLAGVLAYLVAYSEDNFARVGVFADRFGTDALRERIDTASLEKVQATPWTGSGLGGAYVHLEDDIFFFHNSYWAAFVEGGWVFVGAYVGATALLGVGLLRRGPTSRAGAAAEAANIVVLVCALRLGEVFGTTVAMLALAAGLLHLVALRQAATAPEPPPVEAGPVPPSAVGTLTR